MGIPKFARFLITRYPLILKKIKEERDVPAIDNLFLDINGVIHKRAHNNNVITMCKDRPLEEIFSDIFCYVDELVHLARPRSLLMISADGVAPRAKMNQQRARRFRKTDIDPKEHAALRKQGLNPEKMFNSDVISAGTEFMFLLSKAFEKFVAEKLETDPLWKGLQVVLTGVDVPGEGEHKIVEYIRQNKNSESYNPNARHCIYGLDADLIMLSLITHEPNICILREEVFGGKKNASSNARTVLKAHESFEFIYVSILREYLELEFLELKPKLKFAYNLERVIDDFIFFCFFIGNDFLPNLNTLDIDHGALDHIFIYYKEVLPTLDDYITYHGKIDFKKAEKIFSCLARHELSALQEMLAKVDDTCRERDKKKRKVIEDRRKVLKVKKVMAKKECLLLSLKDKEQAFIVNFKNEKIKKKVDILTENYEKETTARGKKIQFAEDLKVFMKRELGVGIKRLHEANQMEESSPSETYTTGDDRRYRKLNKKMDNTHNTHNTKNTKQPEPDTLEAQKGLTSLFDSDEESNGKGRNKSERFPHPNPGATVPADQMHNILKEAAKVSRYILNEGYCSDLGIDDIEDEDIGQVSEPELDCTDLQDEKEEILNENQDLDKVFQQKLLSLYITDVSKAKAFYYKEKLGIDLETERGREAHRDMFSKYLEGLQWVLYYYYRGIQSWRWYYPYHYAPMISDFNRIKDYLDYDIDRTFVYGEPYSPFQSLLFILPRTSRSLFPQCYWSVFETFPELYPEKVGIDFNGKKMPWESVVLLPFLPESVILQFEDEMRTKFHNSNGDKLDEGNLVLSDVDLERNLHGTSYVFTNTQNGINKRAFEIYSKIVVTNLDSNYQTKVVDYNFPSLRIFHYDYTFEMRKQFFGKDRTKMKKTRVINVRPLVNKGSTSEEKIKSSLIKGEVYVDYPFKIEGCIRGIVYSNNYYYLNNGRVEIDFQGKVHTEVRDKINRDWYKKGVTLDCMNILVDVSLMRRIVRDSAGTLHKLYEEESFYVPFELTSLNSINTDFCLLSKDWDNFKVRFENIHTEFDPATPSLLLCKTSFGQLGTVGRVLTKESENYEKYNNENYSKYYDTFCNFDVEGKDWEVTLDTVYNGPLIEVAVRNSQQSSLVVDPLAGKKVLDKAAGYVTMNTLAASLGVSVWALGLITATLNVVNCTEEDVISEETKLSELEHWNIGLNLKSRGKSDRLVLPGFTRYIEDTDNYGEGYCWEFSDTAVELVTTYKQNYPFVFESLEKYQNLYDRSERFFRIYELFSTVDDFFSKLTEIAVWINSLDIGTVSFTTSKSNFLGHAECRKIEEQIDAKNKGNNSTVTNDSSLSFVVNPNYVYQESLPWVPPFMAYEPPYFTLGDRVVNIRSNDCIFVPFGLKGTVSAVSNDFIEVIFDQEFVGGTKLNGRIKSRKGAKVKPLNLINLTTKPPVFLRRNSNKYASWDFKSAAGHYDGAYSYTLTLEKSKKSHSGKIKSSGGKIGDKESLALNKTHSYTFKSEKVDAIPLGEKKVVKVIKRNENVEKISTASNDVKNETNRGVLTNITNHIANESLIQESNSFIPTTYVPKRIITKDRGNINIAFKTNPQDAKIVKREQTISNEVKSSNNNAEYRSNRIFPNESLPRNNLYVFNCSGPKTTEKVTKNKNIIMKENY